LFGVLYGLFAANFAAFNADVCLDLAAQFLALAEKQKASFPLVFGHGLLGASLLLAGDLTEARVHFDQGMPLYNAAEHRPLLTQFGEDPGLVILFFRSKALWLLGYPEAALADVDQALKDARASGHAALLIWALIGSFFIVDSYRGNYATADRRVDELFALSEEKNSVFWRAWAMLGRGWLLGLNGKASNASEMIASGIATWRSTGTTMYLPSWLSNLAEAHAELGQLNEAWRCVGEAMRTIETTKERWFEAEINRIGGEIALKPPEPDRAKAEAHFDRALKIARQQQAKSLELRAAMSMARLWRDQGKRHEARELLAPVYGWFTEGFDTRDLKEAKGLLDELSS
jgi:predicted ATPase